MKKSELSEMWNGWVARSHGAVAGVQTVGVKFRRRMGRSLVTHYLFSYIVFVSTIIRVILIFMTLKEKVL